MELKRFNPYFLYITDPLLKLYESRIKLLELFREGMVPPIYVFEGETQLVFNGNKRTIIARELEQGLQGYLIKSQADLEEAQKFDPRKFPRELSLDYHSVKYHLTERANTFARLNHELMPISVTTASRRIRI